MIVRSEAITWVVIVDCVMFLATNEVNRATDQMLNSSFDALNRRNSASLINVQSRVLESNEDREYQINIQSTAAHIASLYLFEDDSFEDDESIVSQFYNVASESDAVELASVFSSSIGNTAVEERWDKIREIWEWRLYVFSGAVESKS